MKTIIVMSIVLILSLGMLSFGAQKADVAAGKAAYAKSCASCHGDAGEAKDAVAKQFGVQMRHLASKEVQASGDEEIRKAIVQGIGKMKAPKDMSDKVAVNIIAYMKTLAKK